jgi:cytohesin
MYPTRIELKKMLVKCLSFLLLAALFCRPAFCSEIHDAAEKGDLVRVNALLEDNPALVNSQDRMGVTPLYCAADHGFKELVELLLNKGANVNAKDVLGRTPLYVAAKEGHKDVVGLLLAHNAEYNIFDAAECGDVDRVKALLKENPDLASSKSDRFSGQTPLFRAALFGHKDTVELLLTYKADVNARTSSGLTPLNFAASEGHKDVASLLLANKAEYNLEDVIEIGDVEKVKVLLGDNPGLISSKSKEGTTLLHYAAEGGSSKDVVELLIGKGADVNAKNKDGMTPLHWAAIHHHEDIMESLLAKGADVDPRNLAGWTPLGYAVEPRDYDIAKLLLAHGASVNARHIDSLFQTPLHEAADMGSYEIVKLLLANKADVNLRDINGFTPLSLAVHNSHKDVAELLRQHGGRE